MRISNESRKTAGSQQKLALLNNHLPLSLFRFATLHRPMSDPTCKSLEALVPLTAAKLSKTRLPEQFETYRSELHRELFNVSYIVQSYWPRASGELARHWPFRADPFNVGSIASKSAAQKTVFPTNDDDSVHQTHSKLRSNNLTPLNSTGLVGKISEIHPRVVPTTSEVSLDGVQQPIEWNVKAQEGIITYRLPDGLPDGSVLHDKLQQLMKTSTLYLNDRRFWNTLEERFKTQRKVTNGIFRRSVFSHWSNGEASVSSKYGTTPACTATIRTRVNR